MTTLNPVEIRTAVKLALREDLGHGGDLTTNTIFEETIKGQAVICSRQTGILAGRDFAAEAFKQLCNEAKCIWHKKDGATLKPGDRIATIKAPVRTLLSGERTALNFLGHLSGIASLTQQYVTAVNATNATIVDTRKTTPGLRFAEKYAVIMGGGKNHRFRLDDAILIKDNHIAFAGSIKKAISKARSGAGHTVKLEVEVDTLDQLKDVIKEQVDIVLLDNFTIPDLKAAVKMAKGNCLTEASGGVNLETVRAIAETGVDLISVGALTHSAPTLDLGLDIDIANA